MLHRKENTKDRIDDANLQFLVLLQLTIERIDFLEKNGYIFGNIKNFLKNSKAKYENFIREVFKRQESIEEDTAKEAASKLLVLHERVEKALLNQYIISAEERMIRTKDILSKHVKAEYTLGDSPERLQLKSELLIDEILEEMLEKNLFNF